MCCWNPPYRRKTQKKFRQLPKSVKCLQKGRSYTPSEVLGCLGWASVKSALWGYEAAIHHAAQIVQRGARNTPGYILNIHTTEDIHGIYTKCTAAYMHWMPQNIQLLLQLPKYLHFSTWQHNDSKALKLWIILKWETFARKELREKGCFLRL